MAWYEYVTMGLSLLGLGYIFYQISILPGRYVDHREDIWPQKASIGFALGYYSTKLLCVLFVVLLFISVTGLIIAGIDEYYTKRTVEQAVREYRKEQQGKQSPQSLY